MSAATRGSGGRPPQVTKNIKKAPTVTACDRCHTAKRRCEGVPRGICKRCYDMRKDCTWEGYNKFWGSSASLKGLHGPLQAVPQGMRGIFDGSASLKRVDPNQHQHSFTHPQQPPQHQHHQHQHQYTFISEDPSSSAQHNRPSSQHSNSSSTEEADPDFSGYNNPSPGNPGASSARSPTPYEYDHSYLAEHLRRTNGPQQQQQHPSLQHPAQHFELVPLELQLPSQPEAHHPTYGMGSPNEGAGSWPMRENEQGTAPATQEHQPTQGYPPYVEGYPMPRCARCVDKKWTCEWTPGSRKCDRCFTGGHNCFPPPASDVLGRYQKICDQCKAERVRRCNHGFAHGEPCDLCVERGLTCTASLDRRTGRRFAPSDVMRELGGSSHFFPKARRNGILARVFV